MILKEKPLTVGGTTINGNYINEPKSSNKNFTINNYTQEYDLPQWKNIFIFSGYINCLCKNSVSKLNEFSIGKNEHYLQTTDDSCVCGKIEYAQYQALIRELKWLSENSPNTKTIIFIDSKKIERQISDIKTVCASNRITKLNQIAVKTLAKTKAVVITISNMAEMLQGLDLYDGEVSSALKIGGHNND